MKSIILKAVTSLSATMLLAAHAGAQNTPESEPNNVKANATLVTFSAGGQTVSGLSTGSTTTGAGTANADLFRVKTAPAALGIYRHRLALTTTGAAGHSAAIMGVANDGSPSETMTNQTSSTATTPARMAQWYGFGKEENLYIRVTGTTSTTAAYTGTYSTSAVTPVSGPSVAAGSVTISTYDQGHTTDTELFLFDSGMNLLRLSDDAPEPLTGLQSQITQDLTPGTYFIAVSNFNTAMSAALESTDRSFASRMDFPNVIVNSNPTIGLDCGLTINDSVGAHPVALTKTVPYGVLWVTFTVVGPSCPGNECGPQDFNGDGDFGTDADIEAYFACLGGNCCELCFCQGSDFNGDGDFGTDADIEAFFRVLGGSPC